MGLDTYLLKINKDVEIDFDKLDYYLEVGYWRKCYGIDRQLNHMCDRMVGEYSGLITFGELENMYDDACEKAAKIVRLVNKHKGFPFELVDDIFELDDYDLDMYDFEFLGEAIDSVAGEEYSDSIWGTIHTLAMTIMQLRDILRDPTGDDYEYLYISSF